MPYNPKELMKKILAGSDFKLKGSVKGRVRVASRDGAIVNFTAADFGVQSLNDKISLSGEQFERFRARIFGILNSGGRELAGRLTLSSTPKKKARADRLRTADGYAELDDACDFGSFCEGDSGAVLPEAGGSLAKTSYATNTRCGERDFPARSAQSAQDFTSQAEFQDVSQAEFYGATRAEFCVDTAWDTARENLILQNDAAQDDMSVGLAASFEESANARSKNFMPQSPAPANSAKEQSFIPTSRNFVSAQSSALVKDSAFEAQNSNFMAQTENFAAENSFVAEQDADLQSKNSTAQSSASKNPTFANSALDINANDCKPQGFEFSKNQSAKFASRCAANFALENASEFASQDENCVGENSAFLAKGQNYALKNSAGQNLAQKISAQEWHPLNLPPQSGNEFVPEFERFAQSALTGENSTVASSMAEGALGDEPASAAFGSESTFAAKPVNFYGKPARKAPTKERVSLSERRPQALPITSASRPISLPQAPRARLIELKPRFIGIAHRIKISFLKKSASEPGEGVLARVRIPLLMENFGLNDILSSKSNHQMAKKMVRTIADLYIAKDLRGVHIDVPVRLEMGFKSGISDVSNHAFIFKLVEDSLVNNGVIDDDNADIVREIKLFKQDVFDGVLVNIVRFE